MNNLKKFIAIASCAVTLFSFAACGKKAAEETTAAPTQALGGSVVTTEVTTKTPEVHERIGVPEKLVIWENGKKVEYSRKKDIKKVSLPTAAINDSTVKGDKFVKYEKAVTKADIEAMKKSGSCYEFIFNVDQKQGYLGEEVKYNKLVIATSGDHVNVMFFLKGSELVGSPVYVEKGANNEKALSERMVSSLANK